MLVPYRNILYFRILFPSILCIVIEVVELQRPNPYILAPILRIFDIVRLCNMKYGISDFRFSVILALPFDVGLVGGGPVVVDLDQEGADEAFE